MRVGLAETPDCEFRNPGETGARFATLTSNSRPELRAWLL